VERPHVNGEDAHQVPLLLNRLDYTGRTGIKR
jgi:hypothetical protein